MTGIETNVFPIGNLAELSASYRLYRIRGLSEDQAEYHHNRQLITKQLSFRLRTPALVIDLNNEPHLVVGEDSGEPPSPYQLVRRTVYFDMIDERRTLDFANPTPDIAAVCMRFLQFLLQSSLWSHPGLWQPSAGEPFFEKQPLDCYDHVARFSGFAIRPVELSGKGFGICVDVRHKSVAERPLDSHLTREGFRRFRGRTCVYRYGHQWFEIQLQEFSDLNVSEVRIPDGRETRSLIEYVMRQSQKPLPPDLANLAHDSSAVGYYSNTGETRFAPAALCYPVIDTHEPNGRSQHSKTILRPHERRSMIRQFKRHYLEKLRFGDVLLKLQTDPHIVPSCRFTIPDFEFGQSTFLSVRGSQGAQQVSLDNLGRSRLSLLRSRDGGFFVANRLDRQYLILPESVANSFGLQFLTDLRGEVDALYPNGGGYNPQLITYRDQGPKTFVEQGHAILDAVSKCEVRPGYGLVMVHETTDRSARQHDQLAAMVIRKLREFDLYVAVNHSTMGRQAYEICRNGSGVPSYRIRHEAKSKFRGYVRNVALNKVLLTNEKWPFVLATPLHADVVLGIDIKHNTAGITIVAENGRIIRTVCHSSKQKERLLADQIKKYVVDLVTAEAQFGLSIKSIVVHRDGRLWPTELSGLKAAVTVLKSAGRIASCCTLTVLELSKSSPAPLRFFDVSKEPSGKEWVLNAQVGTYYMITPTEAYLCSTGRAFPRNGTVRPLHVRFASGQMKFEHCLEDLFALTSLAWSRPEDCSRYPITLKLTDRRLGEDATQFDADALEFEETEEVSA